MSVFKHLNIYASNKRRPIASKLRAENWGIEFTNVPRDENKYETLWHAKLGYHYQSYVSNLVELPEKLIKERILQEMHWQIYGDLNRALSYLGREIMSGDMESAMETLNQIRNEFDYEVKSE